MTNNDSIRARQALDRQFSDWQKVSNVNRPPKGWLRAIRDGLGMTSRQFARRAGVSQPNIIARERAEKNDSITLGKLREAAAALDCELVYALIPREPLERRVEKRAQHLADAQLARAHHTMELEDQGLSKTDLAKERQRLIDDLLRMKPARLWDEP